MTAFQRGKKGLKSIYVPTRLSGLIQRATGTYDPTIVRAMKRMVVDLADREKWVTLEALRENRKWTPPGTTKPTKLTLSHVYTYYASNKTEELEGLLSSKNLSTFLDGWITWVRANRREEVGTADVYWQQVITLIPVGGTFPASDLKKERVKAWLASREKASPGTRRKYFYALKSFVAYLLDAGVYELDPLSGMKAPKKNAARERWETEERDRAIIGASIEKYRLFFTLIKSTGCDVGSARRAQKADLELAIGKANIRGTKTDRRKVHRATIEPWAIAALAEYVKPIVGNHTLLFPGITNSGASHHHANACAAVGVEDYTLKDSRHSVGVRMRLAGKSFEEIAEQLGTSVYQAVTVYTQYKPEQLAAAKEGTNG